MLKEFAPYLVPLLVVALIVRRSGQARKVRVGRMLIAPAIFGLLTVATLAAEPAPGPVAIVGFIAAVAAGAGLGYLRVRHLHLTVDSATGEITSRTTAVGTILVLGLFAIRFGAKLAFPQLAGPGRVGGEMTVIADGLLIFTVAMLGAQAVALRLRTRPLLAAHAASQAVDPPPPGA